MRFRRFSSLFFHTIGEVQSRVFFTRYLMLTLYFLYLYFFYTICFLYLDIHCFHIFSYIIVILFSKMQELTYYNQTLIKEKINWITKKKIKKFHTWIDSTNNSKPPYWHHNNHHKQCLCLCRPDGITRLINHNVEPG